MRHNNLTGLPQKYFKVPKDDPDTNEALAILLEQVSVINDFINTGTDGSKLELDEYKIAMLTDITSSLLHQAELLHRY